MERSNSFGPIRNIIVLCVESRPSAAILSRKGAFGGAMGNAATDYVISRLPCGRPQLLLTGVCSFQNTILGIVHSRLR